MKLNFDMVTKKKTENRDFVSVGISKIQGMGVFAKRNIQRGTRIIEYMGDRAPLTGLLLEATKGSPVNIYAFGLNSSTYIDGGKNGNEARFINHSCLPNCESYIFDERVFIYAMKDIKRFEELTFDYQMGQPFGKKKGRTDYDLYKCNCGSANCRGTMIYKKSKIKRNN